MGIFFKHEPLGPLLTDELSKALSADPTSVSNPEQAAAKEARLILERSRGAFAWKRFGFATLLLVLLFVGALYTARDRDLVQLYGVLVHGFELLLGGVIGLLVGEAVARG